MKRMIDNKDYDALKSEVSEVITDIETHATDYIITDVVVDNEEVDGFIIKDVKNEITYNIELGGGGKQLYQHNIYVSGSYFWFSLEIINDSNEAIDTNLKLLNYLKDNNITGSGKGKTANGYYKNGTDLGTIIAIKYGKTPADIDGINILRYNETASSLDYLDNPWGYSYISNVVDTIIPL